jgi:hypothetical protein
MKKIIEGKLPVLVLLGLSFVLCVLLATGRLDNTKATKIAAWAGLVLLIIGGLVLLWDETALRDSSQQKKNKPYSFARVQLWWWTMVILGSFLGVYAATGNCWPMNTTCLVLLGISLTTTVSGRMVDTQQTSEGTVRTQDVHASSGILTDILSDENGLSVHRFQALVFNVVYGLSFMVQVFSKVTEGKFPEYDSMVLTLLGISSGAYLAMKMNENKTSPATPAAKLNPPVNTTTGNPTGESTTTNTTDDILLDASSESSSQSADN